MELETNGLPVDFFSLSENRNKLGGMLADDSASMVTHEKDELDLNQ